MKAYECLLDRYNHTLIYDPNNEQYSINEIKYITDTLTSSILKWQIDSYTPLWKYLGFNSLGEYCVYSLYPKSIIFLLKKDNFKCDLKKCFDTWTIEHQNIKMFYPLNSDVFQKLEKEILHTSEKDLFKRHLIKVFPGLLDRCSRLNVDGGWYGLIEKALFSISEISRYEIANSCYLNPLLDKIDVLANKICFEFLNKRQNPKIEEILIKLEQASYFVCFFCGEKAHSSGKCDRCKWKQM